MDPYRIPGVLFETPSEGLPNLAPPQPHFGKFELPRSKPWYVDTAKHFNEILRARWYEIERVEFLKPRMSGSGDLEIEFFREDQSRVALIVVDRSRTVWSFPCMFASVSPFRCDETTWDRYRATGHTRFGDWAGTFVHNFNESK